MASVCNEKRWREVIDIDALKEINTVPVGPRHLPINHGVCLDSFMDVAAQRNIEFGEKQTGLLSHDNMKYVFVADVKMDNFQGGDQFAFTIGFVNYNDGSKSWRGIAGERVFVCSNEVFTGELMFTRKKHTKNVFSVLDEKMNMVFNYFDEFTEKRFGEINVMKDREFRDRELGQFVLQTHRENLVGNANIDRIIKEWDKPTYDDFKERNAWSFQNCISEVGKNIKNPVQRMESVRALSGLTKEVCGVQSTIKIDEN